MPKFLSDHFTLEEAVHSQTADRNGIDNAHPPISVITNATQTAKRMERIRALLQFPITVSSWIRSPILNAAIGGVSNSQHLTGEAVDFICPAFGTPLDICNRILSFGDLIRFDQLILEHSWVHISFSANPTVVNRREVLSLLKTGGYAQGLTDASGTKYA